MHTSPFVWLLGLLLAAHSLTSHALSLTDARGKTLTLERPAQRVVSLAPHVTEFIFAAGAGSTLVGAVDFSNYPPKAQQVPRIGSSSQYDYEALAALKPDVIIGWLSGNPAPKIAQLEALGYKVFLTEPRHFKDIAQDLTAIGTLTGHSATAQGAADAFMQQMQQLQARYAQRPAIKVFYEIWHAPLMTLNGQHLFNQALSTCGGTNVFAALPSLAPTLSEEAVVQANPQVILASGMDESRPEWLNHWQRWPHLQAVQKQQLVFIPPDLLQRPGLRMAEGTQQLCEHLQKARTAYGLGAP